VSDFRQLGVSEELALSLERLGITQPTPVQEETIPLVYAGRDVIGQAQTGTGKTLAFVLPMLDRVRPEMPVVQGLILTPTRELALQITGELQKLIGENGIHALAVYGRQDVESQLRKLQGRQHIVVATPGRLLDHLRRRTISLADVRMLVLDEADQMLHMGFLPEVQDILRHTPEDKQTMLFSATMPPKIRELSKRLMRDPAYVTIRPEHVTVKEIRQWVVETTDRRKQDTLVQLLTEQRPYLAIIFCRTKRRAHALNEALQRRGFHSDELHGDLSQAKREQVMRRFREAKLQMLVATDVAARGLDVEGVTHVFNYDVPLDVESYIHRIGRTGRAGESGQAITLVAAKDRQVLAEIEQGIGIRLQRRTVELRSADVETTSGSTRRGDRNSGRAARNDRSAGIRDKAGNAGDIPASRDGGLTHRKDRAWRAEERADRRARGGQGKKASDSRRGAARNGKHAEPGDSAKRRTAAGGPSGDSPRSGNGRISARSNQGAKRGRRR